MPLRGAKIKASRGSLLFPCALCALRYIRICTHLFGYLSRNFPRHREVGFGVVCFAIQIPCHLSRKSTHICCFIRHFNLVFFQRCLLNKSYYTSPEINQFVDGGEWCSEARERLFRRRSLLITYLLAKVRNEPTRGRHRVPLRRARDGASRGRILKTYVTEQKRTSGRAYQRCYVPSLP